MGACGHDLHAQQSTLHCEKPGHTPQTTFLNWARHCESSHHCSKGGLCKSMWITWNSQKKGKKSGEKTAGMLGFKQGSVIGIGMMTIQFIIETSTLFRGCY